MDKEKVILFIKNRIDAEYRKHHSVLDWCEIASRKIYAELDHLNILASPEVLKKSYLKGSSDSDKFWKKMKIESVCECGKIKNPKNFVCEECWNNVTA